MTRETRTRRTSPASRERLRSAGEAARAAALADPWSFKAWLVGADGGADGGEQPARNRLLHAPLPAARSSRSRRRRRSTRSPTRSASLADDDGSRGRRPHAVRGARPAGGSRRARRDQPAATASTTTAIRCARPGTRASSAGPRRAAACRISTRCATSGRSCSTARPGTGKTFEAKALADRLIRNEAIRRWGPVEYLRNRERVSELVRRQVRRRQLHQAYSYEDFVIGLRVAENGETEPYRGDLLQLIDEIRQTRVTSMDPEPLPWVLILDEINRTDLSRLLGEAFSALDDRDAQIDLPAVGGHAGRSVQAAGGPVPDRDDEHDRPERRAARLRDAAAVLLAAQRLPQARHPDGRARSLGGARHAARGPGSRATRGTRSSRTSCGSPTTRRRSTTRSRSRRCSARTTRSATRTSSTSSASSPTSRGCAAARRRRGTTSGAPTGSRRRR